MSFNWGQRTYIMGILNATPDSFSGDGVRDVKTAVLQSDDQPVSALEGEITFTKVCFRYSAQEQILDDFSLRIAPGESVALVGHTGAGKSSIINNLTGSEQLATAAISEKHDEGRHTTVNSMMIELPRGGAVIDSPGVRDFAPALESLTKTRWAAHSG